MEVLLSRGGGFRLRQRGDTRGDTRSRSGRSSQGIGTLLLETLIEEGRRRSLPALSLSVERDNGAARLYQRLGFVSVGSVGSAVTMILKLV